MADNNDIDKRPKQVKSACMNTPPKIEISDELDAQIADKIQISKRRKTDVVREALRNGLPQSGVRFQPTPLWLEERLRDALAERAEPVSAVQFRKRMQAIAHGR